MTEAWTFTAPLLQSHARTGEPREWFFVTVPQEHSDDIHDVMQGRTGGFGSVRVAVAAGSSRWETSVFPDAASGCYVLPVKKAVRVAERVEEGDDLTITLTVRDAG